MAIKILNGAVYDSDETLRDTGKQYAVRFKVLKNGVVLIKEFDSPYLMNLAVNKIKHSKTVLLMGTERRF